MRISIVAQVADNRIISKRNKIPWNIEEIDEKIQTVTKDAFILMGRRTHEMIARTLPDRINLILSQQKDYKNYGDSHKFSKIEDAFEYAKNNGASEIMIFGGATLFDLTINIADKLYIVHIGQKFKGDKYFPMVDFGQWETLVAENYDNQIIPWKFYELDKKLKIPYHLKKPKKIPFLRRLTDTAVEKLREKFPISFTPDISEEETIIKKAPLNKTIIKTKSKSSIKDKKIEKGKSIQKNFDYIQSFCSDAKKEKKENSEVQKKNKREQQKEKSLNEIEKQFHRIETNQLTRAKKRQNTVVRILKEREQELKAARNQGAKTFRVEKNTIGDSIWRTITGQPESKAEYLILYILSTVTGLALLAIIIMIATSNLG